MYLRNALHLYFSLRYAIVFQDTIAYWGIQAVSFATAL